MTNVPFPSFTATGFLPPTEQDILAGLQADMNAAFQTVLNFGTVTNPTPQGQLCATMAACIGNAYDMFCALANGVDPAYAFGRLQDAIGRIYFMTRNPGSPTIAQCQCIGLPGTIIPVNSLIQSQADGTLYAAISGGQIPNSGTVTLAFAANATGPIPCPANTLKIIYKTVMGWDTVNNANDGVLGTDVETAAQFEIRRQASVQKNTVGYVNSTIGALFDPLTVPGLLDAYVCDNYNSYDVAFTPQAVANASIVGTALTVSELISGTIKVGQTVTGSMATNIGVASGTRITGMTDSTHWTVTPAQNVGGSPLNFGGVIVGPHCLYVAAVGGVPMDIAKAIWSKKAPGIPYYPGNTTVTVYEPNPAAPDPGIPYPVVFEIPLDLPFVFKVTLVNSPLIPSDALTQIQKAIVAAFAGAATNSTRARIGSLVLASTYYPAVAALGSWAEIISLLLSSTNDPDSQITGEMGATFTGTSTGTTNITAAGTVGVISAGDPISGPGVSAGTTIVSQTSGPAGGDGIYVTSQATTVAGAPCTTQSSILVVSAIGTGTLAPGHFLFDVNEAILEGTIIQTQLTGTAGGTGQYQTNNVQSFPSGALMSVIGDKISEQVAINQAPVLNPNCISLVLV